MTQIYRCVGCHEPLDDPQGPSASDVVCGACARSYPVCARTPTLVLRPWGLLGSWARKLRSASADLDTRGRNYMQTREDLDPTVREHGDDVLACDALNRDLLMSSYQDVFDRQQERTEAPTLADSSYELLCGWDPGLLLPYLNQDWGDTRELDSLAKTMAELLEQHVADGSRGALSVLGSGTGGLLQRLAPIFERAIGIELAAPIQLVTRRLLDGETLRYGLVSRPGTLECAPASAEGIKTPNAELIVADVADLPLVSGSQSVVVSQYLLDVIPNATTVVREIHRVLEDGGVWINLGLPFHAPGDPAVLPNRTDRDIEHYLERESFDPLHVARHWFVLGRTSPTVTWGGEYRQAPLLFMARKSGEATTSEESTLIPALASREAASSETTRALRLGFSERGRATLLSGASFSRAGAQNSIRLQIGSSPPPPGGSCGRQDADRAVHGAGQRCESRGGRRRSGHRAFRPGGADAHPSAAGSRRHRRSAKLIATDSQSYSRSMDWQETSDLAFSELTARRAGTSGYRGRAPRDAQDSSAEARPDATAWVALARRARRDDSEVVADDLDALVRHQLRDGRVVLARDMAYTWWPTALAVLAWQGSEAHSTPKELGVRLLLTQGGLPLPRSPLVGHDTTLVGWTWIQGTHSWVEPTAVALLALRAAGHGEHPRCDEARRLLLDRQLSTGWNYGNTRTFGREMRPTPDSTGAALAALAGFVPQNEVASSLDWLEEQLLGIRSPLSLGWGLLALSAWDRRPADALEWVEESWARQELLGAYDTALLGQLLCAAHAERGLLGLLESS